MSDCGETINKSLIWAIIVTAVNMEPRIAKSNFPAPNKPKIVKDQSFGRVYALLNK
jgi:hypothetical protein